MKRILIVLLLMTLFLCGCDKKETKETKERFVIEYQQAFNSTNYVSIIRDTETGKAYLFAKSYTAGGLTILEESD